LSEDPYAWLEDLASERTRRFIEEHNRRLRGLLGGLSDEMARAIGEWYRVPYIQAFNPCAGGVYAVSRVLEAYKVEFKGWRGDYRLILTSRDLGENVVVWGIYPTSDCRMLAVAYSFAGRDVGRVRILDTSTGEVVDEFEGSIEGVLWLGRDRLYYSVMYRSGRTPDGVEAQPCPPVLPPNPHVVVAVVKLVGELKTEDVHTELSL